jgi:hypothetical protein
MKLKVVLTKRRKVAKTGLSVAGRGASHQWISIVCQDSHLCTHHCRNLKSHPA